MDQSENNAAASSASSGTDKKEDNTMKYLVITIVVILAAILVYFLVSGGSTSDTSGSDTTDSEGMEEVEKEVEEEMEPVLVTISGTVTLNGAVEGSSDIVMYQKDSEATEYTEFKRMAAVDGAPWTLSDAIKGDKYSITADLFTGSEKVASGNVILVIAPDSDELIIIDTEVALKPPQDAPRYECKEEDKSGNWEVGLTFPRITDAAKYYLRAGTSPEATNLLEQVVPNDNPNEDYKTNVTVKVDMDNYTSYAYTLCSDCDLDDRQNWSAFSPITEFMCESEETMDDDEAMDEEDEDAGDE